MSKHIEWIIDKLSYEQLLELAVSLNAITREDVKKHILAYDFSDEDIRDALEDILIDPEELA
jgi:hypothetical protein